MQGKDASSTVLFHPQILSSAVNTCCTRDIPLFTHLVQHHVHSPVCCIRPKKRMPVYFTIKCRLNGIQCPHIIGECKFLLIGQHRWRSSLMSWSLLHQQRPAYPASLTLIIWEMGGKRTYSCCFPLAFFSRRFVKVQVVQPYNNTDAVVVIGTIKFIAQFILYHYFCFFSDSIS